MRKIVWKNKIELRFDSSPRSVQLTSWGAPPPPPPLLLTQIKDNGGGGGGGGPPPLVKRYRRFDRGNFVFVVTFLGFRV